MGNVSFVFIADDAFALREDFLKPFPMQNLTYEERIFNYRLSCARRVVENAFGILATRFRVFHTTINFAPSKVVDIVLACVVLHHFLRRKCRMTYTNPAALDNEDTETGSVTEGEWRRDPVGDYTFQRLKCKPRKATELTKASRIDYMKYFIGKGRVPWQDRMVQNRK